MRKLVRALGLSLYKRLQLVGALYFPMPPPELDEDRALVEPPPGSPERLIPGVAATTAEQRLFDELGRDVRWPTS